MAGAKVANRARWGEPIQAECSAGVTITLTDARTMHHCQNDDRASPSWLYEFSFFSRWRSSSIAAANLAIPFSSPLPLPLPLPLMLAVLGIYSI